MESLRSNRMLMYAIGASATLVLLLSTGLAPELTEFFEIIKFPTEVSHHQPFYKTHLQSEYSLQFRTTLLMVLVLDILGAFTLDRVCSFLFGETRRKSKVLNC